MTSKELSEKIIGILEEKKGTDIKLIKIEEISSLADYFIIVTGSSNTQVRALSDAVEEKMKADNIAPHAIEGYHSNGWIVLDYESVILHIFTRDAREYFNLDKLWSDGQIVEFDDEGKAKNN
jgi:ribosome-associated protein